jgi:hypothetical protein
MMISAARDGVTGLGILFLWIIGHFCGKVKGQKNAKFLSFAFIHHKVFAPDCPQLSSLECAENFALRALTKVSQCPLFQLSLAMAIESTQSSAVTPATAPEADKNQEPLVSMDIEDFEAIAVDDDVALPASNELANKKVAVRRKIEMYWEIRKLREQLGDFGETDFDF